jgi:hypothetical protein
MAESFSMSMGAQILQQIVVGHQTGEEYRWEDLLAELRVLISSPPTPEVEHFLVELLRFDGEIRLHPDSELPHSMPPEEMLKHGGFYRSGETVSSLK